MNILSSGASLGTVHWSQAVHELASRGEAYVLVTLISVSGSTPRDSGTKMVITAEQTFATIGGGHLEYQCIAQAHELLIQQQNNKSGLQKIVDFQLGAKLGQCCGGATKVLFESFVQSRVNIMLFGAGHVGQALIGILAGLPCKVTWVDSRESQLAISTDEYNNVTHLVSDSPADEVASMGANSYYIVMTHNHQLDFDICQKILQRQDFAYLGLIASNTKWRRFKQRFSHRDIDPAQVERMNCPIGVSQVPGKQPMEVAVSVAAEVIGLYQQRQTTKLESKRGMTPILVF
jgi:xanthine dehydrogenase accessory factor